MDGMHSPMVGEKVDGREEGAFWVVASYVPTVESRQGVALVTGTGYRYAVIGWWRLESGEVYVEDSPYLLDDFDEALERYSLQICKVLLQPV